MRGSKILIVEEEFQTYSLNQINKILSVCWSCLLFSVIVISKKFLFLYKFNTETKVACRAVPFRALSVPENMRAV